MTTRLEQLGTDVANAIDRVLVDDARRDAVLRRLKAQERIVRAKPAPKRTMSWAPGIGLAAAAAVALLVWSFQTRAPLTYAVAGEESSRTDDRPIIAAERTVDVRFSDASIVSLGPRSHARVEQLDSAGASIALEQGTVTVHVPHRATTRWRVRAGPYVVRVTGTQFDVEWVPAEQRFALRVIEGAVELTGPEKVRRTVQAGEAYRRAPEPRAPAASPDEPRASVASPAEPLTAPRAPSNAAPPAPRAAPTPSPPTSERSSRPPGPRALPLRLPPKTPPTPTPAVEEPPPAPAPPPPEAAPTTEPDVAPGATNEPEEPDWSVVLRQGDYEKALRTLDASAIDDATWNSSAAQLLGLGAAARRLRDPRAGSFYAALRSRFPGSDPAAEAAFVLARMSFHRRSYASAATWLETYLRERPEGRFARDASGRLVEVYGELDDPRLDEAAQRYLADYPDGPHADLAREALK